jgi:hypothetical protein
MLIASTCVKKGYAWLNILRRGSQEKGQHRGGGGEGGGGRPCAPPMAAPLGSVGTSSWHRVSSSADPLRISWSRCVVHHPASECWLHSHLVSPWCLFYVWIDFIFCQFFVHYFDSVDFLCSQMAPKQHVWCSLVIVGLAVSLDSGGQFARVIRSSRRRSPPAVHCKLNDKVILGFYLIFHG